MAVRFAPIDRIVLSRDQVRSCDQIAVDRFGVNGVVLMENAGAAAARQVSAMLTDPAAGVCIVAGTGNNGGDGFVVARHLFNSGVAVEVIIFGQRDRMADDAETNLKIIEKMGLPIRWAHGADAEQNTRLLADRAGRADLVVDALLGTGLTGPPREPIHSAIAALNALSKTVVALDVPSGLDCDAGEPFDIAVRAACTITFAANKKGFLNPAAAAYTGTVVVASIGIHTSLLVTSQQNNP
jgi:NAD(P)H-hydrate epimerase